MGGICNSNNEENKSNEVTTELAEEYQKSKKKFKLLLLGAGTSGKSTFYKQLTKLHGEGYKLTDFSIAIPFIHESIIDQMQYLIKTVRFKKLTLSEKAEASADIIFQSLLQAPIDSTMAEHISICWNESIIKEEYNTRASLAINDSANYFFDNIERIGSSDYIPTEKDFFFARIPTTGIQEATFHIEGNLFVLFDVGGQRSERSKWIHCFDCVNAILFIVSLSCYDQGLYEQEEINAMHESLQLFDEIVNNRYFRRASMLLFLNKIDLFEQKIKDKSIRLCFPHYQGPDESSSDAIKYITQQFLNLCNDDNRQIYCHTTCATDPNNVKKVFDDVQHSIVSKTLQRNGVV